MRQEQYSRGNTKQLFLFIISTRLKAVLGQYELFTDRNIRNHLARTIGAGDPMHGCVPHTVYLAHGNSNGEGRGRSRHKSNRTQVRRNMKERNLGTKGNNPKHDLIEDLTIELPEGRLSPTIDQIKLTNLTNSLIYGL